MIYEENGKAIVVKQQQMQERGNSRENGVVILTEVLGAAQVEVMIYEVDGKEIMVIHQVMKERKRKRKRRGNSDGG